MTLTRVTTSVLDANAVSADKLANSSIVSRHLGDAVVLLRNLAPEANTASITAGINSNTNLLQTNVNLVQDNVAAAILTAAANDLATFTIITANLDIVQDNVAAIISGATNFTGEVTLNDDLVVQGNLTVLGDSTTSNSINQTINDRIVMLANNVTGTPVADVGFLFNRGNQGNAAIYYDEGERQFTLADTKDPESNVSIHPVTYSNLKVGIVEATAVNSTTFTYGGTDLTTFIDTRATAVADANDFITYTRLNANVNSVQSNLTTSMNQATANTNLVQDNVTALTSGAVLLIPFTNTNVSTSSSNVYFIGKDVANYANIVSVTVDGIYQAPVIDYVGNFSNNTVQFTDEALPAGLTITITSLT
jgi:hypothetical protein